jgi:hypothetical protein
MHARHVTLVLLLNLAQHLLRQAVHLKRLQSR